MKAAVGVALLLLTAPGGVAQSPGEVSETTVLFDGRSLAGWIVDSQAKVAPATVAEVLTLSDRSGWLRTEREKFGAFVLRFGARAAEKKTRAVVAFFGESRGRGSAAANAYAVPLFGRDAIGKNAVEPMRLMLLMPPTMPQAKALRPDGAWQDYEISRVAGQLQGRVNGVIVFRTASPQAVDGWIGFRAERGAIELRDVRLTAFQPPSRPQTNQRRITTPRIKKQVRPAYTSDAMRAGIQGAVLIECAVDPAGKVVGMRVVRSLEAGLDESAKRAASQWEFEPGTVDGQPVRMDITIELSFSLRP